MSRAPSVEPIRSNELTRITAVEAVCRLRSCEVSPVDLLEASIQRIEAVDGAINALPIRFFDAARAAALRAEIENLRRVDRGPGHLYGLPIAVKDYNDVAGQRTTCGSPIYERRVAEVSDATVEILQRNGAVPVAKSNVPEFGGAHTFNSLFGTTRNPWDLSRSAGGSSGGSAAALASGQVWLATGNDFGGSLRIPASFCGVAALRPSVGRVGRSQFMPTFDSLGIEGPMGRTVRDVALMLDAEVSTSVHDPFACPPPAVPFSEMVLRDVPRGLRIGYSDDLGLMQIDPEVATLCRAAVAKLSGVDAEVDDAYPDFTGAADTFLTLRAQAFAGLYGHLVEECPDRLPPWILENFRKGLDLKIDQILAADRGRAALYRRMASFFQDHQVLALPAVALPAFPVEQKYPTELAGQPLRSYLDWMFLTYTTTLTGCPVVCVPIGRTRQGLPVALQLLGAPHTDALLLQLAHCLESVSDVVSSLPLT